jgi:hypothetical protein
MQYYLRKWNLFIEIKAGCERDIRKVDDRLRTIEMKMWTIAGAISIISFVVSPIGQRIVGTVLTPVSETSMIYPE